MGDDDRPTGKFDDRRPEAGSCQEPRCLGGRFVLLDHLGDGGGAAVVRARDRQFPGKPVAIKLLRSRDEDLRRRFVQEAEILRMVDHPSIVRVYDRDVDGEDYYTVLELIEGSDLFQLTRSGPLPWRRVVEIGIEIAGALDVVHRQGLVHRDVKPANIMLDASGHAKLIDFGVVRITSNYRVPTGATQPRATEHGKALGTPGYLPLEAGLVTPNPSFDVFGLGATLYQLVTGKVPEEPLQPLCEARPGCDAPEDLERVLFAALALEPEDRTQSADELGRALAAVRVAHPEGGAPTARIDGRYELIGLAGTGAKGEAHRAVHRGAGHDVVLKFLRSTAPDDALRFSREAKLLASFNHPAMPRFYDYAPEATPPYIVMAHAPGQLAVRLCASARLKPVEVAAIGVKLARVLAAVHARGVLHRDINANNVLIDANGGVTLLDFGCAELCESYYDVPVGERRYLTPPEARVAIPDGGIGQFAWSAPETRTGQGWSDRSDVYSMGHLLFRLMTGKPPTKGADPPTSLLDLVVTCPEGIATAIESALQVNPRARPTAAQLAQNLAEALEGEEEEFARAVAMATRAARPPLRLVPAAPEGATDWTDHPVPDAKSEPVPALPETPLAGPAAAHAPRRSRIALAGAAVVALAALVVALWGMQRSPAEQTISSELAAQVRPPDPQSLATVSPASAEPTLVAVVPASTMRETLDTATPALKLCSLKARGLLFVDFTIAENGETFAVRVSGGTREVVDCVRAATANLRFQPHPAKTFTEEYSP